MRGSLSGFWRMICGSRTWPRTQAFHVGLFEIGYPSAPIGKTIGLGAAATGFLSEFSAAFTASQEYTSLRKAATFSRGRRVTDMTSSAIRAMRTVSSIWPSSMRWTEQSIFTCFSVNFPEMNVCSGMCSLSSIATVRMSAVVLRPLAPPWPPPRSVSAFESSAKGITGEGAGAGLELVELEELELTLDEDAVLELVEELELVAVEDELALELTPAEELELDVSDELELELSLEMELSLEEELELRTDDELELMAELELDIALELELSLELDVELSLELELELLAAAVT